MCLASQSPAVQYSNVSADGPVQREMAAHDIGRAYAASEPTLNWESQYYNMLQPGADLLPPESGPLGFQQTPVTSTYGSADTASGFSIGGVVGGLTGDPTSHFWTPEVQPLAQ